MAQGLHKINEAQALWKTSRGHATNGCLAIHPHKQPSFALLDHRIMNLQSKDRKMHSKTYLKNFRYITDHYEHLNIKM